MGEKKIIRVVIELFEEGDRAELNMNTEGTPAPSTFKVLGLLEMAKAQYIQDKARG